MKGANEFDAAKHIPGKMGAHESNAAEQSLQLKWPARAVVTFQSGFPF